ncbi:MAG TPA: sugar phosphate isomerase/epimerase [Geminicoccus sp.]|uniref:sugar phosphate isomerase/epimerase family protein n=1 Tax=Geminicoccus sp. TaxID=2024832 RepID=UPI002CDFF63B|nr:sugar phosphate isomerase/epimerase [Geminicoccus sp.]HWL67794.1 sugar phosphate isomerase/epimerase [Geminicoccus sp.]
MTIAPGLQLYSLREFPPMAARIAELAELGYRKVEPYGALMEDVAGLADAITAAGLTSPTAHVGIDRFRAGLDGVLRIAQALRLETVVIPFLQPGDRPSDTPGWMRIGAEVAGYATRLKSAGLGLAWHNHDFEMAQLPDGSRPMEHLLAASDDVLWECDVAWVTRGGEDPTEWIRRHGERIVAAHVKDIDPDPDNGEDGWADVGHGMLDWGLIVPALKQAGTKHWIAEHDRPSDGMRFARRSLATMRSW